ncbi:MAG: exodeoxyribonuclease VII large subunit [Kiritimatiellia bacterium]
MTNDSHIPPFSPSLSENTRHVYTVGDLTRLVKQTLEDEVGRVWVEGEISNFRRQSSGHCYFTLKDERAQLSAVLFAGAQRGVSVTLADGMQVRLFGELSVYELRGQYQLIVRQVEAGGQGMLMARFEALKRRLQAEGLFDEARKRPLPLLPRHVGIVTSPTGAAMRDILNVITRRFPNLHVLLAPARVQGAGAAEEIAAAIDYLNAQSSRAAAGEGGGPLTTPLDVLIVGRGGGSIEDLWCFNEECVARAIARSEIPVISAVGHEIDFTISDFVADVRAPTPSAAAELVVGRKEDFEAALRTQTRTLRQLLRQRLTELHGRLDIARASHVFHAPRQSVERAAQALDGLELRLKQALAGAGARQRRRLDEFRVRLQLLRGSRLQGVAGRLDALLRRMTHAAPMALQRRQQQVSALERQLRALSPVAVLERGYSLTRMSDGTLVRSVRQVPVGTRLRTQVADGTMESVVDSGRNQ